MKKQDNAAVTEKRGTYDDADDEESWPPTGAKKEAATFLKQLAELVPGKEKSYWNKLYIAPRSPVDPDMVTVSKL